MKCLVTSLFYYEAFVAFTLAVCILTNVVIFPFYILLSDSNTNGQLCLHYTSIRQAYLLTQLLCGLYADGSLRGREKLPFWSLKAGYEKRSWKWIAIYSSNLPAVDFSSVWIWLHYVNALMLWLGQREGHLACRKPNAAITKGSVCWEYAV